MSTPSSKPKAINAESAAFLASTIIALYISVLILDIFLSYKYSIGKFYILPVLLIFFIRSRRLAIFLAALGLFFLAAGYVASTDGATYPGEEVLINRIFAAVVIACGAWLAIRYQRSVMALERSEAALREANRIARLGHFEFSPGNGGAPFCSPECLAILGLTDAHELSLTGFLSDIVHPEDRRGLMRQARAALARSGQYDVEFRILRPDGELRDVLSSGQFQPAGKGWPARVTGTLFDVSEWRRTERARRDGEARLQSILEAVPEALVVIDREGMIQTFSASAEALFGYRADEVVEASIGPLMAPSGREEHLLFLRDHAGRGERPESGSRRRLKACHRSGFVFPVELAVSQVRLGRQTLLTIFIRDLTESQRLEEELRQSQKVEAIGRLTGGIAHDFNNLLTVIMGNLEILEAKLAQKPLKSLVRSTRDAAELGAELTDRLLTFGRRQPLDAKRVDLGGLIGGFESLLSRSLGENILFEARVAPDLPPVLVDPAQFQVALFNLALNAKDAMPSGGALSIAATLVGEEERDALFPDASADCFVRVEVRDTGTGMPEDVRRHALEPFFTTKAPGAGTGLGLPMVYGFMRQSNGHLHIDSEPGCGTAIRLYLPSIPGEPDKPAASVSQAALPGRGETILVVEDDTHVRHVNVLRLRELGYRVVHAASGAEALEKLAAMAEVDLLFSDYVMPGGMNGGELAREARSLRPGIGTLLTSGYARPEQVRRGRIEGATWLSKPYGTEELARAVRKALQAARPGRGATRRSGESGLRTRSPLP